MPKRKAVGEGKEEVKNKTKGRKRSASSTPKKKPSKRSRGHTGDSKPVRPLTLWERKYIGRIPEDPLFQQAIWNAIQSVPDDQKQAEVDAWMDPESQYKNIETKCQPSTLAFARLAEQHLAELTGVKIQHKCPVCGITEGINNMPIQSRSGDEGMTEKKKCPKGHMWTVKSGLR